MGDPAVYGGLMQMPYTNAEIWATWLKDLCDPTKTDLMLVAELDGEVVGTCGLHPVGTALRRRHVLMLGISVLPSAQRLGVGSTMMAALCDEADRWVGALRIELNVYTDNAPAIALYCKFGFALEGTQRGYALRDGQYVDSHAMARLHPNPPRIEA